MNDELNAKIKSSMLSRDKVRTEALKMLKSSVLKLRIDGGHELSDEEFLNVVQKEIKTRLDSIKIYQNANQADRAKKEQDEIDIYKEFLPDQYNEKKIEEIVKEVSAKNSLEPIQSNFGKIYSLSKLQIGLYSDGETIAKVVKNIIK